MELRTWRAYSRDETWPTTALKQLNFDGRIYFHTLADEIKRIFVGLVTVDETKAIFPLA